MLTEHSFATGKVTLNYVEGPASGPPLLLLHGGSTRWQGFETIIPDLAQRWQIYAPDLRGHGKSAWTAGEYRLQDYTTDMIALLEQRVREPVHLFGHSLGGMIALMVAAQCPVAVRSVIVGDAPLTGSTWQTVLQRDRQWLSALRDLAGGAVSLEHISEVLKAAPINVPGHPTPRAVREVLGEDSPYFPWMALNLYQHDPSMLTALLDDIAAVVAGYEMTAILPQIRCPVLLLQADPACGGVMTDAEVQQALPLLAQPQHVCLKGISHVLHNEQKEPVVAAIVGFLEAH